MKIDRIELFVSVAKNLSETAAAREHHISQPAVSRHMKLLQDEFRSKFFKKLGRGIELTQRGRAFFNDASALVTGVKNLKRSHGAQDTSSLTIAATPGASAVLLPSIIARFRESHPSIRITLHSGNSAEIQRWLMASVVEFAIVNASPESPSFHVEPFRTERKTAFIAANHRLAKKDAESIELAKIPLILKTSHPNLTHKDEQPIGLSKRGNRKLAIAIRCGSSRSVKELVRHGAGIGILYDDAVRGNIDRGEFRAVKIAGIDLVRQSHIVFQKDIALSSPAHEFLSLLRIARTEHVTTEIKSKTETASRHRQTRG